MSTSNYWQNSTSRRLRRRGVLRSTLLSASALAVAAACGGGSSNKSTEGSSGGTSGEAKGPSIGATPTQVTEQPKLGGSAVAAMPKEPANYDPHLAVDSSKIGFLNLTSNGLFRLKTKGVTDFQSLEYEPDLLASSESPDKTTLVLKIRPGVKWHNVAPVNARTFDAEDVKYNIERMKKPTQADGGANERAWIQDAVDTVQVVDPTTVQVKFKQPFPLWSPFMATSYQKILAREVQTPATQIVGTGPFTLVKHDRDAQASFKKNPDYFKQGLPYLDEWVWRSDTAQAHRIAGLKTEDYAFGGVNPTELADVKKANPKLIEQKYIGLTYPCWGFDLTRPEFQDVRVRQAMFMAVDWDGISKALYDGDAYKLPPIPAGFTQFTAKPADLPHNQFKVADAKALMQAAGFNDGNMLKLEIETNQGYPENIKMQPILQQQLKDIFVDVTALPTVPPTEFLGKRNSPGGGWQVRMWSHASFSDPDEFLFSFYHSTGSRNYGKWGSPQLDAMIEKQRGDVTAEERKKILLDIQKELDDKAYRQGLVSPQPRYMVQSWFRGWVVLAAEPGYEALQVENSWINKG